MAMLVNASGDLRSLSFFFFKLPASTGTGNVEIKAKAVFTLVWIYFKESAKKICFALSTSNGKVKSAQDQFSNK